jgi:uncharacterized phiE125 gp8 family phage protein
MLYEHELGRCPRRGERRSLTLVTAPPAEPLTLDEVKAQLRIDASDEDALLTGLIMAARAHVDGRDGWLGRCLVQQTYDLAIDGFPLGRRPIKIPLPPLRQVQSITYVDPVGDTATLDPADYRVVAGGDWPAHVEPAYGTCWPTTRSILASVTVRFDAGYEPGTGSPTDYAENVPADIKLGLKLLVAHWYENRVPVVVGQTANMVPMTVDVILAPKRVVAFG